MKVSRRTPEDTLGVAKETLLKTRESFGVIPNMYAEMANNGALLDAYKYSYDSFRKNAGFSKEEQEVIFLTISRVHGCSYCVAAHSTVADFNGLSPRLVSALRNGAQLSNRRLEGLRKFTITLTESRGMATDSEIDSFFKSGYNENHMMGIITAIGIKVFSNYFNHMFSPELDRVFEKREWKRTDAKCFSHS